MVNAPQPQPPQSNTLFQRAYSEGKYVLDKIVPTVKSKVLAALTIVSLGVGATKYSNQYQKISEQEDITTNQLYQVSAVDNAITVTDFSLQNGQKKEINTIQHKKRVISDNSDHIQNDSIISAKLFEQQQAIEDMRQNFSRSNADESIVLIDDMIADFSTQSELIQSIILNQKLSGVVVEQNVDKKLATLKQQVTQVAGMESALSAALLPLFLALLGTIGYAWSLTRDRAKEVREKANQNKKTIDENRKNQHNLQIQQKENKIIENENLYVDAMYKEKGEEKNNKKIYNEKMKKHEARLNDITQLLAIREDDHAQFEKHEAEAWNEIVIAAKSSRKNATATNERAKIATQEKKEEFKQAFETKIVKEYLAKIQKAITTVQDGKKPNRKDFTKQSLANAQSTLDKFGTINVLGFTFGEPFFKNQEEITSSVFNENNAQSEIDDYTSQTSVDVANTIDDKEVDTDIPENIDAKEFNYQIKKLKTNESYTFVNYGVTEVITKVMNGFSLTRNGVEIKDLKDNNTFKSIGVLNRYLTQHFESLDGVKYTSKKLCPLVEKPAKSKNIQTKTSQSASVTKTTVVKEKIEIKNDNNTSS